MTGQILILIILVAINALFAATEIAFISLNDAKIDKKAKEGNKKARQIQKMLETPSRFLATIQIGITLAGFLSSAFASDTFSQKLAPALYELMPFISQNIWENISIVVITILLSFVTLVFGELVPKRIAMKNHEQIAFSTIKIVRAISVLTAPFVKLLTAVTNFISKIFGVNENEEELVTEEEIRMMIDQGQEKGTIKQDEKELINNVFEFNDITVSEIMKHRTEIFALDINISAEELMSELAAEQFTHSRIPIYDETIDEIKGILYLKDVLKNIHKKSFKVKNILKDAHFISQNRLINDAFKELQVTKKQMAIVIDEYGGTAGLITMEDILEELVGDIYDEYDKEEFEFEKIDENTYILNGNMAIYDVNKVLGINIPDGDYDTLSGFIHQELGRIPDGEELPIIETEQATFKIEEYEDRRIVKVKACRNNTEETNEEEESDIDE